MVIFALAVTVIPGGVQCTQVKTRYICSPAHFKGGGVKRLHINVYCRLPKGRGVSKLLPKLYM